MKHNEKTKNKRVLTDQSESLGVERFEYIDFINQVVLNVLSCDPIFFEGRAGLTTRGFNEFKCSQQRHILDYAMFKYKHLDSEGRKKAKK